MRHVVVFTDESIRREAVDLLAPTCEVRVLSAYPTEDALIEACRDADAILARLGVVTRRVIEASPRLRIVARHGVGVDRIMFAIDYPYVVNQDGMNWIDTLQISPDDRAKILGGTAKQLLRL